MTAIRPPLKNRLCLSGVCILLQLIAGCTSQPTAIDRQFGQSMQNIKAQQAVHTALTATAYPPIVSDGTIGKAAIDRYHKSYEVLPPPVNIFNIGVGTPVAGQPIR